MYQPRQFDPALLSLMSVAKKVTPQGQPTVAAGIMQQAGVPPQAMPPGPPQGMMPPPPQGMPPPQQGLPGVLQQTQQAAPSVAKNMQEAQTQQMLAQAQPQPAMMAEGGIASLPVGMEEYADGGIVGYAAGGEFDLGDSEESRLMDEERVRQIKERQREEQRRLTAEMLGLPYEQPPQRPEPSAIPQQKPASAPPISSAPPERAAARPPAMRPESAGIASTLPRQAPTGAEAMYLEQLQTIRDQRNTMKEPRTLDQIRQEELAARRARGLPEDPNEMAFKHLEETAALQQKIRDAQLAKEGPERQDALLKGILAPGAMNLGQLFGNSAREIMGAEATQRGNVEARAKEDLVRKQAEQAIRAAIQKANSAELDGDMATRQAELDKAETLQQALFTSQQTLATGRRGEIASDERSARDRLARLTELSRPGETERMIAEYQRILATDPATAEKYLKTAEAVKGLGRGLDLRETSVELRALKDDEAQLLKILESTYGSERATILSKLDQLRKDRVKLMGGVAPVSQQLPAQVLSQLKEGVVTTFANGQQWTLQGGQPKQVK